MIPTARGLAMTTMMLKSGGAVTLIKEPASLIVDACVPEPIGFRILHLITRCNRSEIRDVIGVGGNMGIDARVTPTTGAAIRRLLRAAA
jgi:hypothetical protein